MNKFRTFGIAIAVMAASLSLPSANAALVTVACSGGGSFTIDNVTNTVSAGGTCVGTAVIPDGVLTIGNAAFYNDVALTSVRLPQGLTTIGDQAFRKTGLVTINIPKSVTYVGYIAFAILVQSFDSVNFESGGTSPLTIANGAFQSFHGSCMVLPSNLSSLEYRAFEGGALQNVYFQGDAPTVNGNFNAATPTVYYKTTASGFTNPWYGLTTQASTFTTPAFTLSSTYETATRSSAITSYSLNQIGGSVGCYSIFPAPANGLTFNYSTGVLSGSPTAYADPITYTISGANGAGSASASFTISVPAPPAIPAFTLSNSAETVTAGTAITGYSISSTGGAVATYSISPAARNGLSFNTSTGRLTGTPTISDTGTVYTITATNVSGSASTTYRVKVDLAQVTSPASTPIPDPPQSSTIERFSPTTGSILGGTQVKVTGSFSGCRVANVSIDQTNLVASLWRATSSEVIIMMPPHASGKVEITIWNGCVPVMPSITYLYVNADDVKIIQSTPVDTTTVQVPQSPVVNPGISTETSTVTSPSSIKQISKGPLEKTLILRIYFDLSSFKVKAKDLTAIQEFSLVIAGLGNKITLSITGYAQPTPGSEATDGLLSENRAAEVARALRRAGVTTKVVYAGAGRAAKNVPSSRYVEIVAANR